MLAFSCPTDDELRYLESLLRNSNALCVREYERCLQAASASARQRRWNDSNAFGVGHAHSNFA